MAFILPGAIREKLRVRGDLSRIDRTGTPKFKRVMPEPVDALGTMRRRNDVVRLNSVLHVAKLPSQEARDRAKALKRHIVTSTNQGVFLKHKPLVRFRSL